MNVSSSATSLQGNVGVPLAEGDFAMLLVSMKELQVIKDLLHSVLSSSHISKAQVDFHLQEHNLKRDIISSECSYEQMKMKLGGRSMTTPHSGIMSHSLGRLTCGRTTVNVKDQ